MKLVSACVGVPREYEHAGRTVVSPIAKTPVDHPVSVSYLGLNGDHQADPKYHGGVHQAVYAYFQSAYGFWQDQLGRILSPGTMGENLTIDGLSEETISVDFPDEDVRTVLRSVAELFDLNLVIPDGLHYVGVANVRG